MTTRERLRIAVVAIVATYLAIVNLLADNLPSAVMFTLLVIALAIHAWRRS